MSGLESLDELAHDIQDAYDDECRVAESSPAYNQSYSRSLSDIDLSIRDVQDGEQREIPGGLPVVTRRDMLESWVNLTNALQDYQVYLQYAPALEKVFGQAKFFEESKWSTTKTLVDLMMETIENNDKGSAADCRYVTLLEIMWSYGGHWELSHQLEMAWRGHGCTIDPMIAPSEFRKEAFGVLMSLSWVPKSPGLHLVCGIGSEGTDTEAPSVVQSIFHQVRSSPLPRHDCIHRILARLKNGPNVTVGITSSLDDYGSPARRGCQGLGKTTLAAMVMSHPSVQSTFTVLWLQLNKRTEGAGNGMDYKQYTCYLKSLCDQMGVKPAWPRPILTLEESGLQKKKEEEKMYQVKREMASLLQAKGKGLLLVLDDVFDEQEIEWFWFLEDQSLLVTTSTENLTVDWTMELELLSEEEALQLFLSEADYPATHVLSSTIEAKSIVQRCCYHPLTIRTVARWFRLKQVTAGVVKGLEELNHELSACTAKLRHSRRDKSSANSPSRVLTEVMNLMLSPVLAAGGQPTMLMKMCLSSMAVVFPGQVQLEAVHLLWGQLLRTEPDAVNELGDNLSPNQLRKRVRFISEALTSLGLLSITESNGSTFVEIHHDLQLEYALALAREMQFSGNQLTTTRRWHEAFANAYLAKKVESDRDGLEDPCRAYALENLLQHMLKAGMYQKVAVLLRDGRFLSERLDLLGWSKGIERHIQDCRSLQSAMEADDSITADPVEVAVSIYNKSGGLVAESGQNSRVEDVALEAAKALHSIGFALASLGEYSDAISHYKAALKMAPKGTIEVSTIQFSLSAVYMQKHDHKKAISNLKDCLKVLRDRSERNSIHSEALILQGDSLMRNCEYSGAMELYDRALDMFFADSSNSRVEIGVALGRKGRLYHVMGELDNAYGAFDECLKWKKKIKESSCDLASVYRFLGDISLEKGDKEKVADFYDKSYRMFANHRGEADEVDIHILNGMADDIGGDYQGCQENFELALDTMSKIKRPMMERTAYDLRMIARTFLAHGDFGRAKAAFDKCMEETSEKPDDSLERSAALFDMGGFYWKSNETKSAFHCFEDSLKIRILKLGPSQTVVDTVGKIGELHKEVGEREEALTYFNKALELTEGLYGEGSERVARALFLIGELKEEMDEHVEALAMLGECLEIQRRHLPLQHPDIALTVDALGKIHLDRHNYEKAYQLFIEGLEIRKAKFPQDDPRVGISFHNLGVVSRKGGDCERALQFLLEALHVRKSLEDKHFTVETLLEIGNVHRALGDPESAIGCYEKCLEITLDVYGGEHERVSDILLPLGHAKKDLGFVEDATEFYKRGFEIREEKLGKDSVKTAAAHRSIGMVMFEQGDYRAAIKHLVDFIRIQDAKKQKNTVDYVIGLEMIGDIHKYNDNEEDASSAYAAASNAFRQSKELAKVYPSLGGFLEQRLSTKEKSSDLVPSSFFGRFAGEIGKLAEEVQTKGTIEASTEELEFRRKIVFDG